MHERGGEHFQPFNASDGPDNASPRERESLKQAALPISFFDYYTITFFFRSLLYVAPLNACASRSAESVGTDKIRNVFVCPRPPFQPCTAIIVQPGLIRPKETALRSPNRIRLST